MNATESSTTACSLKAINSDLVTVKQVANALQVSTGTVYNLIKSGELRAVKLHGAIRLNRDEVCNYVGL